MSGVIDETNVEEKITDDLKTKSESGDTDKRKNEVTQEKEVSLPPPRVHKTDFQKDVVYLYQFSRTPTLPSLSPYCLKVETWLRLNGVKYENVDHKLRFKSSKGQLPFVELNGEEIADSTVIISKLEQHYGIDSPQLSKEDKNVSHALICMIENHLCWVHVYWRSKNPDAMIKGYKVSLQHACGSRIPNSLLNFFFKLSYAKKGARKVKAHGLGVHSAEEVSEFGKQDLLVLESTLGEKPFFFGERPTNLDVVAFAHLSQIFYVDEVVEYDFRTWMSENCPGLIRLLSSMKERCFPDWDKMMSSLKLNTHIAEETNAVETESKEKGFIGEKQGAKEGEGITAKKDFKDDQK